MEIWGVQIPIDYLIVGEAVLIAAVIVVLSMAFRRYLRSRVKTRELQSKRKFDETFDDRFGDAFLDVHTLPRDHPKRAAGREYIRHATTVLGRLVRAQQVAKRLPVYLTALNVITSILAVIPLAGAIGALIRERPELALRLDVLGLIVLVVTKGGLWLLTMALIPLLKALPMGVGTGMASYYTQRWLKSREKDREPVEKK